MALKPITIDSADRMTALIIGKAGIGKTSLIRTIPKDQKACVLSAEGGLLCVRDLIQSGQVEGFEITSLQDFKEAYQLLSTDTESQQKYQWIFIDSLTEISGRCVEAMKAKYTSAKDTFQLWGDYNDTMTLLIKGFRDLKFFNIVFTCLDQVEKDELNRRYVGPAITGTQLKDRLTSYFDEVFFMDSFKADDGTEYRAFVTQPWERFPGKDRSGLLELIEKPDLSYIASKIFSEIPF